MCPWESVQTSALASKFRRHREGPRSEHGSAHSPVTPQGQSCASGPRQPAPASEGLPAFPRQGHRPVSDEGSGNLGDRESRITVRAGTCRKLGFRQKGQQPPKHLQFPMATCCFLIPSGRVLLHAPHSSRCSAISGSRAVTSSQWGCHSGQGGHCARFEGGVVCLHRVLGGPRAGLPTSPIANAGARRVCSLKQRGHRRATLRARSSRVPMGAPAKSRIPVLARVCLVRLSSQHRRKRDSGFSVPAA